MMTRLKKQSMPEQEQFDIPINDPPPDNMDIDEEEDIGVDTIAEVLNIILLSLLLL